jgi:hypothetical protein
LIVNKALNLIGGCVPCVAWGRNPRLKPKGAMTLCPYEA